MTARVPQKRTGRDARRQPTEEHPFSRVARPERARVPQKTGESGFAMLLVFVLAAMIAITLYTEMPRFAFEVQRSKEQLLVDRGEQYQLAIRRYFRKIGKYPQKLEDLESTNSLRFLRRRYKDPMTGKDEWRVIHMGAAGMLTDSKIQPVNPLGAKGGDSITGQPPPGTATGTDASAAGAPPVADMSAIRRQSDRAPLPAFPGSLETGAPQDPGDVQNQFAQTQPQAQPQPQYQQYSQNPNLPANLQNLQALRGRFGVQQPQPNANPPTADPNEDEDTTETPNPVNDAGQPNPTNDTGQPNPADGQLQQPPPVPGQVGMPQFGQPGVPVQPFQPQPGQPFNPNMPNPNIPFVGRPYMAGIPGNVQPGGYTGQVPGPVPIPQVQPDPNTPTAVNAQNGADLVGQMLRGPRANPQAINGASNLGGQSVGGGIAGVASTYEAKGIMRINKRSKYTEWEFVYDPKKDAARLPGQPGGAGQAGNPLGPQTPQPGGFGSPQPNAGQTQP